MSSDTGTQIQIDVPKSWFSVVWGGKYSGISEYRCKGSWGHPWVDIRVASGTEVKVINAGVVVKSYDSDSLGGLISIKHEIANSQEPIWSIYAQLKRRDVQEGQIIFAPGEV